MARGRNLHPRVGRFVPRPAGRYVRRPEGYGPGHGGGDPVDRGDGTRERTAEEDVESDTSGLGATGSLSAGVNGRAAFRSIRLTATSSSHWRIKPPVAPGNVA